MIAFLLLSCISIVMGGHVNLFGHPSALPDFVIVGVQKAGTTSLKTLLDEHPSLCVAARELKFFGSGGKSFIKNFKEYKRVLGQTLDKCESEYPGTKLKVGEKSPMYLFDKGSLEDIKSKAPNAKIIVTMREPLKRAQSSFAHFKGVKVGRKTVGETHISLVKMNYTQMSEDFTNELNCLINHPYEESFECDKVGNRLSRGLYDIHLKRIYDLFPRTQVFPMVYEEWTDPETSQQVFNDLFKFLDVPTMPVNTSEKMKNVREYDRKCLENEEALYKFFRPHVENTEKILGRSIKAWKSVEIIPCNR
eukprot:m.3446 g.3446  ORF g.3446 m.3446 type:complete len:306 (+) comp2771_c0_seq1:209-1126(+)